MTAGVCIKCICIKCATTIRRQRRSRRSGSLQDIFTLLLLLLLMLLPLYSQHQHHHCHCHCHATGAGDVEKVHKIIRLGQKQCLGKYFLLAELFPRGHSTYPGCLHSSMTVLTQPIVILRVRVIEKEVLIHSFPGRLFAALSLHTEHSVYTTHWGQNRTRKPLSIPPLAHS